MSIYYVYIYINPLNNIPFYVGYGKNKRMFDHLNEAKLNLSSQKGQPKLNTIRKLLRLNVEPIIKIIDSNLSLETAHELEKFLIELIGRKDLGTGPLTNLRDGGEGGNLSLKIRKHLSDIKKGVSTGKKSEITISKLKESLSKLKWYNNGIKSIRCENAPDDSFVLGRIYVTSEETKLKLSNSLLGIKRPFKSKGPYTEEHKSNISIATKGKKKNNTIKKECPYCGVVCGPQNFSKYHGNNCKLLKSTFSD